MKFRTMMVIAILAVGVASIIVYSRSNGKGQFPQPTGTKTTLRWDTTPVAISMPSKDIHLQLATGTSPSQVIIGVHVDDKNPPALNILSVQVAKNSLGFGNIPADIKNWPKEKLEINPGVIKVNEALPEDNYLLIYLTTPTDIQFSLSIGGTPIALSKLTKDVFVQNGEILTEEVKGVRSLLAKVMMPNIPSATPDVTVAKDGKYIATSKGLGSHLIKFDKPRLGATSLKDGRAILQITINEEGQVENITRVSGEEAFIAACEAAVRTWTFRPFRLDEKSVRVVAHAIFFFDESGNVTSPIFANAN